MTEHTPRLTKTEEKTLRVIVTAFAEEPFTCEALEAAAPWSLTGYEAEIGVAGLRRRGIVTTRKKAWGERIHTLTPGVFVYWQQSFFTGAPERLVVSEEAVVPTYEPKRGMSSLLFGMLAFAEFSGLPLTQKGTLHKRDLLRLSERLDVTDDELQGLQCSFMHQDKYGIAFAVIYDTALRLGLLTNGIDRDRLAADNVRAWLRLSPREMEERLLTVWWDVYTPNDVWLQHAAALLRSLNKGQWTTLEKITGLLAEAGVSMGKRTLSEAAEAVRTHWLQPMSALGWLELGQVAGSENEEAVRWKPEQPEEEPQEDKWYVQPDFEVLVTPGVPYFLRWELEAACQYCGGEQVERYRITQETWRRAIDSGRSFEQLIDMLRTGSKYGIPSNVEETIREWGNRYGTVSLEEVTLLRCRYAKHAEDIRKHPLTAAFFVAALGDRDLIVKRALADELYEVLGRQGYSPRKANEAAEAAADPDSPGETDIPADLPEGIVYSKRTASLFPVDPEPPVAHTVQMADQVPQAWVKQFRRYHLSTMRDIMETAVRLKTNVKLGRDGEERTFYPRRIERAGDRFRAVGFMDGLEVSVVPEEWGEVQLLLPDLGER